MDANGSFVSSDEGGVQVFISSVMDDEMQPWRDAAVEILSSVPYLFTWAFEHTPPSSEVVDYSYLRKVRESYLVFWLVGSRTTDAVEREVHEALASHVRLLVFRLPFDHRDDRTNRLLQDVPTKWSPEVKDLAQLREVIRKAVGGEIARTLRGIPALAPLAEYDRLGRESRARCMARWIMAGIEPATAEEWARRGPIECCPSELSRQGPLGLVALVGGMGAGKSFCADNWLQHRIMHSAVTPGSAIPIHIRADTLLGSLISAVREGARPIGSPEVDGVDLVLDDLSRLSDQRAADVVEEALQLNAMFPRSTVLITTRPIPGVVPSEGLRVIQASLMSETDALALLQRACGGDPTRLRQDHWAPSLREAIRWPLFAILAGIYLRENAAAHKATYSELLAFLIERSLRAGTASRVAASQLLRRLAVLTMEREQSRVPVSEVGRPAELVDLHESGLVELDRGMAGIPLDILREWLAAQAISEGEPSVDELLEDSKRLSHWMYPLMAVIGLSDFDAATEALAPLVERRPGLAARLISQEAPEYVAGREPAPLPDAPTIGQRVLLATDFWIGALWPASSCLAAVDKNGRLRGLGVEVRGGVVDIRWRKSADGPPVTVLGSDKNERDWISYHSGRPALLSSWPWSWSLSEVRNRFSRLLRARNVPLAAGPLLDEFAYEVARHVICKRLDDGAPVALDVIVKWLEDLRAQPYITVGYRKGTFEFDPGQLESAVAYLESRNVKRLRKPYPAALPKSHDTWEWHGGDEGIVKAVKAVLAVSLGGYRASVQTFLPRLRPDLLNYVLQPAEVRVRLLRPESPGYAGRMYYVLLPVEEGRRNSFDVSIAPDATQEARWQEQWQWLEEQTERIARYRPDAAWWARPKVHQHDIPLFGRLPASRLAMTWLNDDLLDLSLVNSGPKSYDLFW